MKYNIFMLRTYSSRIFGNTIEVTSLILIPGVNRDQLKKYKINTLKLGIE